MNLAVSMVIEVCIFMFKKRYKGVLCPTTKQVYNWINEGKINIDKNKMCYKRRKNKTRKI